MEPNQTKRSSKHIATAFWLLITIIPIIGIIISLIDPFTFYSTQEQIRGFLDKYGSWAPFIFIGIQILQVIIAPLSHYSAGYMGGFLFGSVWGTLYNYVGRVIGHIIAFWLSRIIGSPIVRKLVPATTINKYDKVVTKRADVLFLIYFLPFFPDDEVSYLVGLSKMRFRWFLLANIFGQVGGSLGLAYLGSGIDGRDPLFWALTIITLAGFPLLFYLARRSPLLVSKKDEPLSK